MIGGLAAGIAAWIPVFILSRLIVVLFREKVSPKIARSKFVAGLSKAPIIGQLMQAVRQFSEAW